MTPINFLEHLTNIVHGDAPHAAEWWHLAALRCWERGHVQNIMSRDGSELYLARFWLTPPKPYKENGGDGSAFESGNSLLLHFFARGDDDGALHDHPWDSFTTDVLSGGYTERRPPLAWRDQCEWRAQEDHEVLGLSLDHCETLERRPGGTRERRLGHNQHAVEEVLPETWTAIATGPRVRSWIFHPPGLPCVPWRTFLASKRAPVAQAGGAV